MPKLSQSQKLPKNGSKPVKPYQSKQHSMSVECPPKPQNRREVVIDQNGIIRVAEALALLLVAGKSIQAIMKNEARKWQLVTDSHPNFAVVHKIEAILEEALEMGEDVLVNYLHKKPPVPMFTETPRHRAYMGYEDGVG